MTLAYDRYNTAISQAESNNNPSARGQMHPGMRARAAGATQITATTAEGLVRNFPEQLGKFRGMSGPQMLEIIASDPQIASQFQSALFNDQVRTLENIRPGASNDPVAMALTHRWGPGVAKRYLNGALDMSAPPTANESETPAQYLKRFNQHYGSDQEVAAQPAPKRPGGYTGVGDNVRGADIPRHPFRQYTTQSGGRGFEDDAPNSIALGSAPDAPPSGQNYMWRTPGLDDFKPANTSMPISGGYQNSGPTIGPNLTDYSRDGIDFQRPQETYIPHQPVGGRLGIPDTTLDGGGDSPAPSFEVRGPAFGDAGGPPMEPMPWDDPGTLRKYDPVGDAQAGRAAFDGAHAGLGGVTASAPPPPPPPSVDPALRPQLEMSPRQHLLVNRAQAKAARLRAKAGADPDITKKDIKMGRKAEKLDARVERIQSRAAAGKSSLLERVLGANSEQRPWRQEEWADELEERKQRRRMEANPNKPKVLDDAQARIQRAKELEGPTDGTGNVFWIPRPNVLGPKPRKNTLGR